VSATPFCGDDELGYRRSRTRFAAGAGLALDRAYRLAHLPLVAPDHPDVVPEGGYYRMGAHERAFSVVLPVPADALEASPAYRALDRALRASSLAGKIAWSLPPRRRDRLHATLCGGLGLGRPPVLDAAARRALAGLGPVEVELRGLFSGEVNVGRLYLRAYPARVGGENAVRRVQRALGRPETDLYLVGLHNLVDGLDAGEAADLAALIDLWWDRPLLRFQADALWLVGACDDLVLDAAVEEILPLTMPARDLGAPGGARLAQADVARRIDKFRPARP